MIIREPYGFIYITTNMMNGKRYIGQKKFCNGWQSYLGSGILLIKAMNKYGKENFYRDIVAIAYSKSELNELEKEFIDNYNATDRKKYYNITKGGEGALGMCGELNGMYGKHHSEESKLKIKKANSGEKNYFYGKHHTEESRIKISTAKKGKNTGIHNPRSKKIICIDNNEIFDSISSVKNKYGYSKSAISACCRNKVNTSYNKVWMFLDEYNQMKKDVVNNIYMQRKRGINGNNNPNSKEVVCLNTREKFSTLKEAGEKFDIKPSLISSCCAKTYKSVTSNLYGKLVFRYNSEFIHMTSEEIENDIMYGKYNCNPTDRIICLENKKVYYCARQVEEETGIFATSVTACCKGRYKTVGKKHWIYLDKYKNGLK